MQGLAGCDVDRLVSDLCGVLSLKVVWTDAFKTGVVDDGVLCLNVGGYREGCDVDRHVLDRSNANKNNSITTFCSEFRLS